MSVTYNFQKAIPETLDISSIVMNVETNKQIDTEAIQIQRIAWTYDEWQWVNWYSYDIQYSLRESIVYAFDSVRDIIDLSEQTYSFLQLKHFRFLHNGNTYHFESVKAFNDFISQLDQTKIKSEFPDEFYFGKNMDVINSLSELADKLTHEFGPDHFYTRQLANVIEILVQNQIDQEICEKCGVVKYDEHHCDSYLRKKNQQSSNGGNGVVSSVGGSAGDSSNHQSPADKLSRHRIVCQFCSHLLKKGIEPDTYGICQACADTDEVHDTVPMLKIPDCDDCRDLMQSHANGNLKLIGLKRHLLKHYHPNYELVREYEWDLFMITAEHIELVEPLAEKQQFIDQAYQIVEGQYQLGVPVADQPVKKICSWCSRVLSQGTVLVSHGVCKNCHRELTN